MFDVAAIAASLGQPEAGIRLLIGLFSGYLVAAVFRAFLWNSDRALKNLYFVVTGLTIAIFCYGWDVKHSLITSFVSYMLMFWSGPNRATVALVFIWNMGYLLWAYHLLETDDYDINWTTPQCILCLRLIALAFDYRDRGRPESTMSRDQVANHIKTLPSFLEVAGFCYFYGGFLIGPQFSFRRYQSFLDLSLYWSTMGKAAKTAPVPFLPALKKLAMGVAYLGLYSSLGGLFLAPYMLTDDFAAESFGSRLFFIWCMGKFALMKYIGSWLITEGAAILSGIAYQPDLGGCHGAFGNVLPWRFETTLSLRGIVESFNITTNKWVKNYVFRRLVKQLRDKFLAMMCSLLFLAIWHGFHFGYVFVFLYEYLTMEVGSKLTIMLTPLRCYLSADTKTGSHVWWKRTLLLCHNILCFITRSFCMHYGLISFELLTLAKSLHVFSSVYFIGHIVPFAVLFLSLVLPMDQLKHYGQDSRKLSPRKKTL